MIEWRWTAVWMWPFERGIFSFPLSGHPTDLQLTFHSCSADASNPPVLHLMKTDVRCAIDWSLARSNIPTAPRTFPRRGRPPCLTDNDNWDVFLCGSILKIAGHMANTRRACYWALNSWKCVAPGIGNLGQLQQRGPHKGADQRPTGPRDRAGKAGAAASMGGQRLHSAVLFCFTPHTHAQLPFDCLLNYVQSNN